MRQLSVKGMKENVISGHLIPANLESSPVGEIVVGSKRRSLQANRRNVTDFSNQSAE